MKPMAKSKHARKKQKRVIRWAIWLGATGEYAIDHVGRINLYSNRKDADAIAGLYDWVGPVELRKI